MRPIVITLISQTRAVAVKESRKRLNATGNVVSTVDVEGIGEEMSSKCPNCSAIYVGYNDHDTGKPSPSRWVCDTFVTQVEKPNFECTSETFELIASFLTTHSDPSARALAKSLTEKS